MRIAHHKDPDGADWTRIYMTDEEAVVVAISLLRQVQTKDPNDSRLEVVVPGEGWITFVVHPDMARAPVRKAACRKGTPSKEQPR